MLASPFMNDVRVGVTISPQALAEKLGLPMTGLARIANLNRNTLAGSARSQKVQGRLGEIAQILDRATALSGDEGRAVIWFKHTILTGFGKTPEQLVEMGHADLVLEDLERIEAGVYS